MLSFRGGINVKEYNTALFGKKLSNYLKYLVNKYGGAYLPFDDTGGSVARVINPALALGRDVVINGDFASDTVWAKGDAAITISGGTATWDGTQAGNADLTQSSILAASRTWQVTFTVSGRTAGTITPLCGTQAGTARSTNDTFTETITANGADLVFRGDVDFDGSIDNVIVRQTNIAASTAYPGAELLTDGDMEAEDTSAWGTGGDPVLSKETTSPHGGTRVLRVAWGSTSNPDARQNIITIGKRYRATGYARGDGTYIPTFRSQVKVLWTGTSSTDWQAFDVEFDATSNTIVQLSSNLTGAGYVEFDDVSVREVNPLNGDITGVTINQDAGSLLKKAYLFDGTNDYVDAYSPELNSLFDPTKGTLLAFAKVANAGVWTDGAFRYALSLRADADNTIEVFKRNTNNALDLLYVAGGTQSRVSLTGLTNTDWLLLTLKWDTTVDKVQGYLNGTQSGADKTGLGTWIGNLASNQTTIGASSITPTAVWDGLICHPVLFRDVLTDAEILKIAQLGGVA